MIEDYFIYRLTGKFAHRTIPGLLFHLLGYYQQKILAGKCWTIWKSGKNSLHPVVESGNVIGKILPEVTEELGLGEDITICTGALDQAAGAIGAGNIREGMFSETIGAALAVCVPVSRPVFGSCRKNATVLFPAGRNVYDPYLYKRGNDSEMVQR